MALAPFVQGIHFSQSKNARLLNLTLFNKIDTSINLCANSESHVYPNDEKVLTKKFTIAAKFKSTLGPWYFFDTVAHFENF